VLAEDTDTADSAKVAQEQIRCSNLAYIFHTDSQQHCLDSSAQSYTQLAIPDVRHHKESKLQNVDVLGQVLGFR